MVKRTQQSSRLTRLRENTSMKLVKKEKSKYPLGVGMMILFVVLVCGSSVVQLFQTIQVANKIWIK